MRFLVLGTILGLPYFQDIYREVCPPETSVRMVPNQIIPKPGDLVECKLLDLLIYVDSKRIVHVTLMLKGKITISS